MKPHIVVTLTTILLTGVLRSAATPSDYMTINEFCDRHPEQRAVMKTFDSTVRKKGVPSPPSLRNTPVTLSFIYPGEQVSDYWRRSIISFKKRMDEIGLKYSISEYFSKPVVDYRVQERHIRKALENDPEYMVFTLDAKKHRRIIERIISQKKPKLILQNITTPLHLWEGRQPFLYVGFDHATGTEILAEHYLKNFNEPSAYAVLFFSQGYVSEMRGETFIRYLGKNPELKLVSSYYTDGNRLKANKATLDILNSTPDIRFIYACSTDVALGAVDALKEKGKTGKVLINGWGGGSSELEAILSGALDVTVMRMNDDNGVAMAEAIRLDIEGKADQVPVVYSGEFVLIEKGIGKESLEKLKRKAFRYSNSH